MIRQATPATIQDAAEILQKGGLVAFPTETVFGLGADATNGDAIDRLYTVKDRPRHKAFAIMIGDLAQAEQFANFDPRALTLAKVFWPGPLSMVLPAKENGILHQAALAGNQTISLRIPKQETALALLRACNTPLAVPSANESGHLSSIGAGDAARDLGDKIDLILADTHKAIGIESTIIDLTKTPAVILRLGAITQQEIETLIGPVELASAPEASITLKTKLRLNAIDVKPGEAFLGFGNLNYIGASGIGFAKDMPAPLWRNLSPSGDLHEAAANLYTMLHDLDEAGAETIAVMKIPMDGLGITLNDRLKRITG